MNDNGSQDNKRKAMIESVLNNLEDSQLENIEYFSIIFKTLSEGVALNEMIYNEKGDIIDHKILAVNDAFYKVADYDKEVPVIGSLASRLYGLEEDATKLFWEQHKTAIAPAKVEFFSKLSNKYFIVSTSPIINNRFVSSFFDITERKKIEEKISAVNDFSTSLISSMQDGFTVVDLNTAITDVNPAMCTMTGFTREELIGQKIPHPFWALEEYASFYNAFEKALSGSKENYELTFMRKNGERFYVVVSPYAVKNSLGETINYAATFKDVTDRKLSEAALQESELQYRLLFQNLNGNFALHEIILDELGIPCDYRYLAVNSSLEKEVGLSTSEIVGKRCLELFPQTEKYWIEIFGEVALTGKPILYENYSKTLNKYYELYSYSPKKGQFALIGRDVTDRKKAEKAIQESQELLKFALEGSGDGIWDWNIPEDKIKVSKQWKEMFGYADNEMESLSFEELKDLVFKDDLPEAIKELQLHLNGSAPIHIEHRFLCKDNSIKWVLTRGMVVSRDVNGEPLRMIGTDTDISRIKYAEKQFIQASKLASLGEMSAGIAHEINNPLAIILGMARSLAKSIDSPEKFTEKIEAIQKASLRISKIVNGLKKFSRSTEEKSYFKCSLSSIIEECLVLTSASSSKNETQIIFGHKTDAKILCAEVEIEQVLINLINNAIDAVKSLDEKWVRIDIFNESNAVILRVTDSGKGIPLENQPRLFDPFFTTKAVGEGTGLGLSIIKGILDEHQATIVLDTSCPHTCFEIRFKKIEVQNGA